MKKFLLLSCSLIAGISSAFAIEEVIENEYLTHISPNGVWAAGAIDDGSVVIRNLESGQTFEYFTEGEGGSKNYYVGNGYTPVSNTGIVVGATNMDDAAYWENGKWYSLKVKNTQYTNSARSITPDGSVICGGIGQAAMSLEADDIMSVPAVWYRQADGSYGDPVILPHPVKDFTGRRPQYVTATAISADGNTIVGQISDYAGMSQEPLVYKRDASGEWNYSTPFTSLLNIDNISFPEYPGDFDGAMPSQEEYMSKEELAAFTAAWEAYQNSQRDDMPQYEDYMTADEIVAYQAAFTEWYNRYSVWQEKWDAFESAFYTALGTGYNFVFNNVTLSADGKYYGTTRSIDIIEDPLDGPKSTYYPVVLLTDGSAHYDLDGSYPEMSFMSTAIANEGVVLASYYSTDGSILPQRAYAFPELKNGSEAITLEEYIGETNPEVAEWMEENMTQSVLYLTPQGKVGVQDFMCSGWASCTPDLSTIICAVGTDTWEFEDPFAYYSYVFSTGMNVHVEGVADAVGNIEVLAGGLLKLNGNFSSVEIFDIAGNKVFSSSLPSGTIATGLKGLYIIHAISAEGTASTIKAVL